MTTTPVHIGEALRALAAELSAPDLTAAGRLSIARELSALAERADEGRMLITTRGPLLGADPMRERGRPSLRGPERLYRERGGD